MTALYCVYTECVTESVSSSVVSPSVTARALRAFAVRPGRSRERRQIMQCNTQTDCLAGTGFVNVSSELVRCVGGMVVVLSLHVMAVCSELKLLPQ